MAGYINVSGNYDFGEHGIIHVNVRYNARNIRARWKGGCIVVSAPAGIEYDRLKEVIGQFAPRLEKIRPQSAYHIGQSLQFGDVNVRIIAQHKFPDRMFAQIVDDVLYIEIGTAWDMEAADTIYNINKNIRRLAQIKAHGLLIPRAQQLAAEVNAAPLGWEISNGARTLGHCNSRGIIALSYMLVLYPEHLRDYVIYHELAHLTEMNHSSRFHEICDRYCKGREKQWQAELKSLRLPVTK